MPNRLYQLKQRRFNRLQPRAPSTSDPIIPFMGYYLVYAISS